MARPCKNRFVSGSPSVDAFHPKEGADESEKVILTADEFEAIRLADLQGYEQSEAAIAMNISRQTFGRILAKARNTIADALVNGKILEIGGGTVIRTRHKHIHCRRCRRNWDVPNKTAQSFQCPRCQH